MKWSGLMLSASELNVDSGLYKLSTNRDVPLLSSRVQRRDWMTLVDSRQVHVRAVAKQYCDALGRTT
jgi:hypothetical protein